MRSIPAVDLAMVLSERSTMIGTTTLSRRWTDGDESRATSAKPSQRFRTPKLPLDSTSPDRVWPRSSACTRLRAIACCDARSNDRMMDHRLTVWISRNRRFIVIAKTGMEQSRAARDKARFALAVSRFHPRLSFVFSDAAPLASRGSQVAPALLRSSETCAFHFVSGNP